MYTPQATISRQKDQLKNVSFQNGGQKEFSFHESSHVTKIWKTTFPKEFLNENWLIVEKHEYIHILKNVIQLRNGDQNKFCYIVQ